MNLTVGYAKPQGTDAVSDLRKSVISDPLHDCFVLMCYPCPIHIPFSHQKGAYLPRRHEMTPASPDPLAPCT